MKKGEKGAAIDTREYNKQKGKKLTTTSYGLLRANVAHSRPRLTKPSRGMLRASVKLLLSLFFLSLRAFAPRIAIPSTV